MLEAVAFRFAKADNASCTKAGKALGPRSHKYSCLMFIYSVALQDFSILLPNFAMMSSHSPALSFSFLLSRFHRESPYLYVLRCTHARSFPHCLPHKAAPSFVEQNKWAAGAGKRKSRHMFTLYVKVNTPWIKKPVNSKMQHRLIGKTCQLHFCETPKTYLLYPYKLLQYQIEMNIRDS